ncbi:acetyl-/propionyl-coenzyme A carboxylase subunit alpha [Mycobacterium lentiflavum]|uniref:Biotin-dependent 3-methylcrotonyl-coenzyme A carboxylase alpha1 subunit n=1 Tax=Mycobacterium lentiflavum TaxID=141349 RepID=A0A0E4H5G9_MYCLN|nr:biotin carboxylase N-terminal domain-containing protein [Mycobacterium lentiflavum]CQD23957.1 acetyl-/propionyl-coenzyme A carboxylase subunit alpha [Mycobacterium lentiflavum]
MIQKLLVANRGEIAARVMRTAHAMGIQTVAVYSDADADAPFVGLADEAVPLPGVAPSDTYLNAPRIIDAAVATEADAVHPGYGFLSENAGFATACAEAGLVFVGPPPAVISAMGSKVEAKALMEKAGVPVLPGATLDENADLALQGQRVGYPLLVKAAFGGGGRGMRVVESPDELADAVASARREAAAAFGDSTVFLERYIMDPRHVEVQIIADTHGTVGHLFERDCSIQRRHQKIVEECPSPAVDDTLRAELGAAAVAAAKAIGYVGAGTVEFVLWPGGFAFLEVNTRLQVEHPVTELVTDLDLVELQLRIAEGDPLPPEALEAQIHGHAIEARLYAEDVCAGFLPATGVLHRFAVPDDQGVRVDTGVIDGSVVSPHYDPMLAKVIAHGATRAEAVRRLARTLSRTQVHGVTSNRDLLVGILREPEFLAGDVDTGYLIRHDPAVLAGHSQRALVLHAAAAALAAQKQQQMSAPVLRTLPPGWRNVAGAPQRVSYCFGDRTIEVAHRLAGDRVLIEVDGERLATARVLAATPERIDLEVDGVRRSVGVHRVAGVSYADSVLGSTALVEVPRFPDPSLARHAGSLLAPMPGTVVRVAAAPGAGVLAGQPLIVLEAMKMEHTVTAPAEGTLVEVCVAEGDQVDTGQMLAIVEDDAGNGAGGRQ